jgi:MoxR-like ATPase
MNTPQTPDSTRQAIEIVAALKAQIRTALIGQDEVIDHVLAALLAAGHVLIEGVPGLGKTLLVQALARTFNGRAARIQFTPDLMPSDITGHTLYDQAARTFVARRGPVFTNLLLADEINRAPAKTQAALLEVMQEGQVTIEGEAHALQPPFMVLATQNPIEHEGTYPLPEAQLDRFLLKIRIDYPDPVDELALVRQVTQHQLGDRLNVEAVNQVITPSSVLALQRACASIVVADPVLDYAVRIVRATRSWNGVSIGAGPRGGIALVRAARGAALMAGRGYVTPDDIKRMALPALRHRLTPAPELQIEGQDSDALLDALLEGVEAPRI